MSNLAAELEQELELELELEHESEHEHEAEHEAFFNHIAAMADRTGRSHSLRRIALAAAKQALKSKPRAFPAVEGEGEGELGEFEAGPALELNLSSNPALRADYAAMMEHLGHAAAEAANEQEAAEHFLPLIGLAAKFVAPKLIGLAAKKLGGKAIAKVGGKLLSKVAPRILGRVAPRLTRGVANITRTLYRNNSTRPLVNAVPRIARTTMAQLSRRVAQGQPVTPQLAARTLARQAYRTLSNPRALAQTFKRSMAMDRRFHNRTRNLIGRPVGAMVRAASPVPTAANGGYAAAGVPIGVPGMPAMAGIASPGFVPTMVATRAGGPACICCGR